MSNKFFFVCVVVVVVVINKYCIYYKFKQINAYKLGVFYFYFNNNLFASVRFEREREKNKWTFVVIYKWKKKLTNFISKLIRLLMTI